VVVSGAAGSQQCDRAGHQQRDAHAQGGQVVAKVSRAQHHFGGSTGW